MAKAILTDIEGTITPLAFIKEVLSPYAYQHLPSFLVQHYQDPGLAALLRQLRQIAGEDLDLGELGDLLRIWTKQDLKVAPLKSL